MIKRIKRNNKEEYYRNISEDTKIQKRSYANIRIENMSNAHRKGKKRRIKYY